MKISLEYIDKEQFLIKEGSFLGQKAFLINPSHVGCDWDQSNKIFRSSIWSESGELLSAGFPKFTNWGENPHYFPIPKNILNCNIYEKIDGSLCIVDRINNKISVRTRGTFSYETLDNSKDFEEIFKLDLNKAFDLFSDNLTLLFEITTPNQKIVIDYGNEVKFKLLGAIDKYDYSLSPQYKVDDIAMKLGWARPKEYYFKTVKDIFDVKDWKNLEGVCVYSNNDQDIHKVKSLDYLKKHAFKGNISLKNLLNLFMANDLPIREEFEAIIQKDFDYECLEMAKLVLDDLYFIYSLYEEDYKFHLNLLEDVKKLNTRKEQALILVNGCKNSIWVGVCFTLLDNKKVEAQQFQNLFLCYAKNS